MGKTFFLNFLIMKINFLLNSIFALVIFCLNNLSAQNNQVEEGILDSNCEKIVEAPFHGTIFINPDIITPEDSTTFVNLLYSGREERIMFDRRVADWITIKPHLFPANYNDSIQIEIQVNPEFGDHETSRYQAGKFAPIIGQLSKELRKDVKTVWIHKGDFPFGGGNNNLLIHTDYSAKNYEGQGILEETFIHEAAHTSLDAYHSNDELWIQAQQKDCVFISDYAEDHPLREDVAESFLPYLAIRYRPDRIPIELKNIIEKTMPNRIKYFDNQNFNMSLIEK